MNKTLIDRVLIYGSSFLRSLSIGMIAVLLAIYLMKVGFSKTEIGVVVSAGLIGSGLGNLFVTCFGDRLGRRKMLCAYALLSATGAIAVAIAPSFYSILAAAFFGMFNARGKDRGAAMVLESAILPSLEDSKNRTKAYAWYSLIQDVGLALGGIAAGLPTLFARIWEVPEVLAFKFSFGVYALLMLTSALFYCFLSAKTELPVKAAKTKLSPGGKKVIMKLASLFALDSLAGGFLTSALIAYFFYERFNVSVEAIGLLFFFGRCLNAVSYFGSVWLSKRIGLIRAMVFTHSPSHLCLIAIAFAPTFPLAVLFFLARESLVEMDVPTRNSYVMAVVKPEERTKAAGITSMVRMLGWATAPAFAGYLMQEMSLAWPLFIGAGIKLSYDFLLFLSFRKIKPPEEPAQSPVAAEPAAIKAA
jgi:MFS family permease